MKNLFICVLSLFLTNSKTFAGSLYEDFKVPAISCGVALVGATAVGLKLPFGVGVCLGIGTYHLLNHDHHMSDYARLDDALRAHESSLAEFKLKTNREYSAYREAIREIVVESIGKREPQSPSSANEVNQDQLKKEILEEARRMVYQEKEKIIDGYIKEVIEQ